MPKISSNLKYRRAGCETHGALAATLVHEVCDGLMSPTDVDQLVYYMTEMKFIPGGRYLWYAGRDVKYYNNCFLLKAENDNREDWATLANKATAHCVWGRYRHRL